MRQTNVVWIRPRRFNVGNETIDVATRALLRAAFEERVNLVRVPAQASEEEGSISGMTASTVHDMNLYADGVVVGGGNLYENGQLDVDLDALRALRPPLLQLGLSYGRIYDDRRRLRRRTDAMPDHAVAALGGAAMRTVARDDATLQHLKALGVDDAVLGGCATLLLSELVATPPAPVAVPPVLLSVRDPALMSVPLADRARVHGEVRRLATALAGLDLGPVQLLCHDKRDLPFAASFVDLPYILPDDVHEYLGLLRAARLVVSFRLHAFLPCLSFGTPTVNVSYDERSSSLPRTLGLAAWDVPYLETTDLTAAVMDRVAHLPELDALVTASRPTWTALADVTRAAVQDFATAVDVYHAAAR